MCALNVANWSDKSLVELADLLKTGDFSSVASFIAENFLCIGSRIMTDPTGTTLRAIVNTIDDKAVDLSPGIFQHGGFISELDSLQTINILNTSYGSWGTGKAANATLNRWSIVCVKNNEQAHTPDARWFVDDSVVPNTYSQQLTNTLINKAYYDILVVHGTDEAIPSVPDTPTDYWTIAEVYVPANATSVLQTNIYDTADPRGSQAVVPNWLLTTRVLRLEFWSTLFGVDHDLTSGYHKQGDWHIGSTQVLVTGTELNRILSGAGAAVTASSLTKLTDGTTLSVGELHSHGAISDRVNNIYSEPTFICTGSWEDISAMSITVSISQISSFLMLYEGRNGTWWSAWIRFIVDGSVANPIEGYGQFWLELGSCLHFHGVALNLAVGSHTFKVQTLRGHVYGSKLSHNQFTVITF